MVYNLKAVSHTLSHLNLYKDSRTLYFKDEQQFFERQIDLSIHSSIVQYRSRVVLKCFSSSALIFSRLPASLGRDGDTLHAFLHIIWNYSLLHELQSSTRKGITWQSWRSWLLKANCLNSHICFCLLAILLWASYLSFPSSVPSSVNWG